MRNSNVLRVFVPSIFLAGCGSTATYLAPQQSVYYKAEESITLSDSDLQKLFDLKCMKIMPQGPVSFGSAKEAPQCLYIAVDAAKATQSDTTDRKVRDKAIAYLLNVSETNCSNFLDRAFANRSELDMAKNLGQDIATGVGTLTAFNTPAVTAALGLTNLVVGKSTDNINSTYYLNQTFQAFEAAVATERARIKSEILAKQANRPPVSTDTAVQYTLFDALADIRNYDAACSMRVGLAKLIETQDEKKRVQLERSAAADREATQTSLEKAEKKYPTQLQADGVAR